MSQKSKNSSKFNSLNVLSWRKFSKAEMLAYIETFSDKHIEKENLKKRDKKSDDGKFLLVVRKNLSPVDVYCYLKARFGEPNGMQTFLGKDDSDNWIHWDYYLKAGDSDVLICGAAREIHFILSENLGDKQWHELIVNIKGDYSRVGIEKSAILESLERWVIFPNKFAAIATICEEHHTDIVDNVEGYNPFQFSSYKTKKDLKVQEKTLSQLNLRAQNLYKNCLELSLLTPILAEAFINMLILMFCKLEIRNNKRQLDVFIRSNIDTKICDLFYKCENFTKPIDSQSIQFKNFKRIMDKRNDSIHGNIDPIKEQIETIYFEGKRPLYKDSGDHIGKMHEILEKQHQPYEVIKDYENIHIFFHEIVSYLSTQAQIGFWYVMEDHLPGYDINRKIVGSLLPRRTMLAMLKGQRYDDELMLN